MSSRPLIKESLYLLNICGIDPDKYNDWSLLRAIATLSILSAFTVNMLLECVLNWQGLDSIENLSVFIAVYQVIIKFFLTAINRKSLLKVLNKMEKFWPTDICTKQVQNKIAKTCTIVRQSLRFMLGMVLALASGYFAKPILQNARKLPFHTYYPVDLKQSPAYELALIFQLIFVGIGVIALIGLDSLFFALIFNLTFELKILKEAFAQIRGDTKKDLVELHQAIDHHNLVLECIKDVRGIYSLLLLNVYFYDMLCICAGLLSIIVSGFPPTFESFLQYGVYAIFYLFQLFFYCTAGTHLTTESEDLSAVIYDTDWWITTQPELRRTYVMIIQRANKAEKLTAGGMFDLSLDSYRKVVRSALSLFTLVEAVYKNN